MKVERLHAVTALAFAASVAATIAWCGSMAAMPGMAMPGGWTMSMTWMRMPGQGWLDHAGMFLGTWAVMMFAMMLPSFQPVLAQYWRVVPRSSGRLAACVSAGYFATWIFAGALLWPVGVVFADLTMRIQVVSEAVPTSAALVVLAAGAAQFTAWKARQLACCRHAVRHSVDRCRSRSTYRDAWRHGMKIGVRCVRCCAGLMAVLLVVGVMDLAATALVTAAISAERLLPPRSRAAQAVGAVLLLLGSWMLMSALRGPG